MNFEQKLAAAKADAKKDTFNYEYPYIQNLNEDPMLNGKIKYSLKDKTLQVGKKNADPPNDIVLGGLGICGNHAVITFENERCFV